MLHRSIVNFFFTVTRPSFLPLSVFVLHSTLSCPVRSFPSYEREREGDRKRGRIRLPDNRARTISRCAPWLLRSAFALKLAAVAIGRVSLSRSLPRAHFRSPRFRFVRVDRRTRFLLGTAPPFPPPFSHFSLSVPFSLLSSSFLPSFLPSPFSPREFYFATFAIYARMGLRGLFQPIKRPA